MSIKRGSKICYIFYEYPSRTPCVPMQDVPEKGREDCGPYLKIIPKKETFTSPIPEQANVPWGQRTLVWSAKREYKKKRG